MSAVDKAVELLAAHHANVGPITGSWSCWCGTGSTNNHSGVLTTFEERADEWRTHVAQALDDAGLLATDDGGSLAMQRATFPNSLPPRLRADQDTS